MITKKYIHAFAFLIMGMGLVSAATQHHPDNPLHNKNGTGITWDEALAAALARAAAGMGCDVSALPQNMRENIVTDFMRRESESSRNVNAADAALVSEMEVFARIKPLIHPKTIAGVTLLVAGGYAAYRGGKVFFDHLKSKLETPPFVEETNDEGFLTMMLNYFLGVETIVREPSKRNVVINEADRVKIEKIVRSIRNAKEFNRPSRHYLFYGPPGVGKTMLARQLAYLSDTVYYIIKASTFVEKDGAEKFRMLMRRIRSTDSRAIIFVDEADQLLRHQSELSNDNARVVLNLIKDETGESNNRGPTFIFASNLPKNIDTAMKSRLRTVEFKLPDFDSRKKILKNDLKFYAKTDARSEESLIDISAITPEVIEAAAHATDDMSGRDLSLMIEELLGSLADEGQTICTVKYFTTFVEAAVAEHKASAERMDATHRDYVGAQPAQQVRSQKR